MKVTIVSTLPHKLAEAKPGQIPGIYIVNEAPNKKRLGITHIGDAHYFMQIPLAPPNAPPMRVDIAAERVANAIINDYTSSVLGMSMEPLNNGIYRRPGLFTIDKVMSEEEVLLAYADKVQFERNCTTKWFEALVMLADDDWSKSHQHKMITDIQKIAANYLELKNREWNQDMIEHLNNLCQFCRSSLSIGAVICSTCKEVVDPVAYAKMKGEKVK